MRFTLNLSIILILLTATILPSACKKKADSKGCLGYFTQNGDFTINGEEKIFVFASMVVFEEEFFNRAFHFIGFMGKDEGCKISHDIHLTVQTAPGAVLGGTYPLTSSSAKQNGDADGLYRLINEKDGSDVDKFLVSGTLVITDMGDQHFDFDVNGTLDDGSDLTLRVQHKFE